MSDEKPPAMIVPATELPKTPPPRQQENRNVKRAWGGRMNVEEAWADGLALDARCSGCAAPRKMVRCWIRTYMPLPDFYRLLGPVGVALHRAKFEGQVPVLETKHGAMVFISEIYVCSLCAPSAKKAAAKHPSYFLVEVREPPKHRLSVAVPRGPRH